MAKTKTFAEKALKALKPKADLCIECGEALAAYKVVKPVMGNKGALRFTDRMVKVCKCNLKEVLES